MANNLKTLVEAHGALLTFGICGLVGILVDLDHAVSYILWSTLMPHLTEGRLWHTPLLILVSLAICGLGAYHSRLYIKLVLILQVLITGLVIGLSPHTIWSWIN